ncbi:4-hydroxy-tetrahydrodipicolinate synthase [Phytopseudomonas seleniipraecipitans]|uniref:4-hydroxy-tetrahydrodipicolinate synthase n=1 Tax=Phytopseudomonas seleniipraecipitans TaxID=640205 RepID=A0A1G7I4I9_9GAMM|nr:4-hydroxy-tetrahydrodipicolinate synthase [Pseudomonas seleniipraecipitans]SDF07314.1 4-hydroxy-tetrahydrodipicolinate synthase [Pseudomonas seleniipraecipitans]
MSTFSGVWVALVTPFRDGQVDFPALRALAVHLVDAGAAGLVVCGTSGEAAALEEGEQLAVLDAVLEVVPACRVVMGLSGNNQAAVLARLRRIQSRPLAGVLVPAPYYIRPSQQGLLTFFEAVADASHLPIILYDIPYRSAVSLELDTLRQLARHPRIVAIKDCGGDPRKTQSLIQDGVLDVLTGEDEQLFTTLCLGGSGAISAAAHLRTADFVAVVRLLQQGDLLAGRAVFRELLPLIRLAFAEPNPAPVKSLLAMQGLIVDELREPMLRCSDQLRERMRAELL